MTPSSTLSSSARRALRAAAHHLDPVVMIGQHGLTPPVLHEIDLALTAHALIKVRVQSDERETREAFLAEICQKLGCENVQHLGKLLVLWRNAADSGAVDDDLTSASGASKSGRGPRAKLPPSKVAGRSGRAPARGGDGAAPKARSSSTGGRGAPRGRAEGERYRYGEPVAPPPQREGWAPRNRRGAARFGGDDGEGGDGRDGYASGGRNGPPRGGRGIADDGAARPPRARSSGGFDRTDRNAGGGGGRRAAPASGSRWGDRRDGNASGGGFDSRRRDRDGDASAGGAGRAPRGAAGGGGWSNRDNLTGKPRGFSRGGTSAATPKPRARRRLG
ncbi:MAG: YhbY family RNA-binding protein [Burkholderiales bacterium]|nr:YhbY family RNA-binding protein [Burkholderiales bacterium]